MLCIFILLGLVSNIGMGIAETRNDDGRKNTDGFLLDPRPENSRENSERVSKLLDIGKDAENKVLYQ